MADPVYPLVGTEIIYNRYDDFFQGKDRMCIASFTESTKLAIITDNYVNLVSQERTTDADIFKLSFTALKYIWH